MCWEGELADYNFKVRYRPGNISQDYGYLSRYLIAETNTNKVNLEKGSTSFVNNCLLSENNWLPVSSVTEKKLEKHLNLEPENGTSKIKKTLSKKAEQVKKPCYFTSFSFITQWRRPNFNERNIFFQEK